MKFWIDEVPTLRMEKLPQLYQIALVASLLLTTGAVQAQAQSRCGVERWPVKAGMDVDVASVDTAKRRITVAELAQIPRPSADFPYSRRVPPFELRTYVVRARLARVVAQDDSDIHLVLRDLHDASATIVAEIPSGGCTSNLRYAYYFEEVRRALRGVPRNGLIEIVGLGFFDYLHGQSGMAPNGFEIHPVLSLQLIER